MTGLWKFRKPDLITVTEELGLNVSPSDKIANLIEKIQAFPNFDEKSIIAQLEIACEDRKTNEQAEKEKLRLEAERLKLEADRETERLKLEAEKLRIETEERKLEAARKHEIEILKLQQVSDAVSTVSQHSENLRQSISLKNVMQKFDPEKSDISLFLTLFERQARKAQIEEDQWTMQLLALLPVDIAEIIIREPEAKSEDFAHVKQLLLSRFKLSPEAFRTKFLSHNKRPDSVWRDLVFELQSYLNGWLEGVQIEDFESLKKLMIADQIKKRAPHEIRDQLIDQWTNLIDPEELAKKMDEYEAVRRPIRKNQYPKPFDRKSFDRRSFERKCMSGKQKEEEKSTGNKNAESNWRDKGNHEKSKIFEKRREPSCYECGSKLHLRPNCPALKKVDRINHLSTAETFVPSFAPYLSEAHVNGFEMTVLRDTGSSIDLVSARVVKPEQYNGETVWLKQALENEFRCLPLANVELKFENLACFVTKAAVLDDKVDMQHYLLGNQTSELLEEIKQNPHKINHILTRSQTKNQERLKSDSEGTNKVPPPELTIGVDLDKTIDEQGEVLSENEVQVILPSPAENEISALAKVDAKAFQEEQEKDGCLSKIWEKAREKECSEYVIENGLLFRKSADHRGIERKQILVPQKFRSKILKLCHEDIASHLGATKSKDKILRYFFWPNVVKETEEYVRTCDPCQKIGKPRDKRKAPLKIVPIIREVFSRLNVDVVGPLPITEKGNRYILTALCLASKYPEAIPIADSKSETIIEALLNMFSRVGFPKELQADLGTCFTSNLTSSFLEKFGIKVIHSSVHHPESNPVERWHRSVKRLLKVLCLEQGKDWERHLPAAMLALRTVTHESTGFSPAELVFGKNLRTPETLIFEKWVEPQEEDPVITEYVFELINRLQRSQELAAEKMKEMQGKRKKWYDKNTIRRNFKPGDPVLVLATSKPNKLAVTWIGPGIVEQQISETNYIVRLPERKDKSQIFHVNLLKPYYKRAENVNSLICEKYSREVEESDLEISYPVAEPNVFDFEEIVKENELAGKLTPEQIEELRRKLTKYKVLFSNEPGRTDLIEHNIDLICEKPVRSKPYRTSPRQAEILKAEIKRMLDLKIIEIGESDYMSPMILVETAGKEPRPCIDYRKLNSITRAEYYPLPNIEERVEKVSAAKYITVIDLTKGYWQIPLSPKAQRLAAFCTNFGSYRPLVMPFGLMTVPYCFSKFIVQLLNGCEEFCVLYLDDIAVFSNTWEEHLEHLDCVLNRIKGAKLTIKPAKCKFAQDKVKYLGHLVGGGSRTPAEAKIKAVLDFPTPKTKTEVRRLIGMSNYYARYIKDYAIITEPLTNVLKGKNRKENIIWTNECERAFTTLKKKLTENPILYSPDYSKDFIIQTDASDIGVGVIMAQRGSNKEEHPVLFLSRKFTEVERRYSATEKECAGIIFAIKKLRHYLDGQTFVIETDHNPLVWLKNNAGNNPRLMRWSLALQPYNYTVVHRPGKDIKHVDCLSRI